MQNTSEPLKPTDYWTFVHRRRRSMFIALLVVWGVACLLAWTLPPRYRSDTTILIQEPQVPQQFVLPNVVSDIQAHLQTLTGEILSGRRLQAIIDDLHLYSSTLDRLFSGSDVIARMRKDITIDLNPTTATPGAPMPKSSVLATFTISFSGSNPRSVQEVTSRLASLFIDENLHTREQQSENTTQFLDQQLQQARTHLDEERQRIKQFKAQFLGQLPDQLQSNLQILNALQVRLQQANDGLNRSEEQKLYLTSMMNAYREVPSLAGPAVVNVTGEPDADIDTELLHLKSDLAQAQSRYTNEHPTVIQIKDEIAKAEILKAQMKKGDQPTSRALAEVQSQLKGAELDIQNRKQEVATLQSRMQAYETRLNETPVREQQLADLSGDYDQNRENYDLLVRKRDNSVLATNMERNQQGENFVVLDPPRFPVSPYFPNRLSFTIAGLALGLVAAICTAFLRETLDDRFHADKEVSTVSKLPTLVSIPLLITARDTTAAQWRVRKEVACAIVTVVVMAGSTLLAYYYG